MKIKIAAVLILTVLAGCSGLGDVDSLGPGETEYPPGVNESGLQNTNALLDADNRLRNDTSFVSRLSVNITRTQAGEILERNGTLGLRVSTDPQVLSGSQTRTDWEGDRLTINYWQNESVFVQRNTVTTEAEEATGYDRKGRSSPPRDTLPKGNLEPYLNLGNFTSTGTTGFLGGGRIVVSADEADRNASDSDNVTSYSGRLVVDSDGRIHSVDVTYNKSFVNETGVQVHEHYEVSFSLSKLGEAMNVSKPGWYTTAHEEATVVDLEATAVDDRYIEVTHTGEDPVETARRLYVKQNGAEAWSMFDEPFEPGDTVYVYVPISASGSSPLPSASMSRQPPESTTPLSGKYRISVNTNPFEEYAATTVTVE